MEFVLLIVFVIFLYLSVRKRSRRDVPKNSDTHMSLESRQRLIRKYMSDVPKNSDEHYEPVHYETRQISSSKRSKVKPDDVWIPANQQIQIAGYTISHGLIYVGQGLSMVESNYQAEPALINPRLSVKQSASHYADDLTYWPSYEDISPQARATYLTWLSEGRNDPNIPIGYVFLFFYGLERRLIVDAKTSVQAEQEASVIIAEVERLLNIYAQNGSFRNYASHFLNISKGLFSNDDTPPIELPEHLSNFVLYKGEYSLEFKQGLAHFATKGLPLPAEWAQSWLENHPETRLRTPANRCSDEFSTLFRKRYHKKYGDGIMLKPNKTPIELWYRPASLTFGGNISFKYKDLPDLTALSRPVKQFYRIAESCVDELDAYSRYLGRNPHASGSLAALALLPSDLLVTSSTETVKAFKRWLHDTIGNNDYTVIRLQALLNHWPLKNAEKVVKSEAVAIAQFLAKLGYGIEPDVRFDSTKLRPDGNTVLFRLENNAPENPTKTYTAAATVLRLAAAVSGADGEVSEDEERHFEQHLESILNLSKPERQRLQMHLQWLLISPPSLAGLKRRVSALTDVKRKSIAQFSIAMANADGHIDPKEIRILKKIYSLLQLDVDALYSDIHNIQTGFANAPVTIRSKNQHDTGYKIPTPALPKSTGDIDLNMSSIERTLEQTEKVQSILTDIFTEEEDTSQVQQDTSEPSDRASEQSTLLGLDAEHSQLVDRLVGKSQWSRAEFEGLCAELGLLPDGAIEIINEAAFEHFDAPLLEDDEPIEINPDIVEEINI